MCDFGWGYTGATTHIIQPEEQLGDVFGLLVRPGPRGTVLPEQLNVAIVGSHCKKLLKRFIRQRLGATAYAERIGSREAKVVR